MKFDCDARSKPKDKYGKIIASEKRQLLSEHVSGMLSFIDKLNIPNKIKKLAKFITILHDLGKFSSNYQKRLDFFDGLIPSAEPYFHQAFGIRYLYKNFDFSYRTGNTTRFKRFICDIINGHHGGLSKIEDSQVNEPSVKQEFNELKSTLDGFVNQFNIDKYIIDGEYTPFDYMIVFAILVEADGLNAEFATTKKERTYDYDNFNFINTSFENYYSKFKNPTSEINKIRNDYMNLLLACNVETGTYGLYGPTGIGKTLAMVNWALKHAIQTNKQRIIIVVPVITILNQTMEILQNSFGDKNVIAHFSDNDYYYKKTDDIETINRKESKNLACQNWDAPIVLTTNVQFIESALTCKVARSRKRYNFANSVIVFDEAQQIPYRYMTILKEVTESLNKDYNTTFLFASATLPDFNMLRFNNKQVFQCKKLMNYECPEILKRVRVIWKIDREYTTDEILNEVLQNEQALLVVNCRKKALEFYDKACLQNDNVYLLSKNQTSDSIKKQLIKIKDKLKNKEPIILISTQLIEAGVDISFPIGYRILAPFDSVVQVAGRINRNGEFGNSCTLTIFKEVDGKYNRPPAEYDELTIATEYFVKKKNNKINIYDCKTIEEYYNNKELHCQLNIGDGNNDMVLKEIEEANFNKIKIRGKDKTIDEAMKYINGNQISIIIRECTEEKFYNEFVNYYDLKNNSKFTKKPSKETLKHIQKHSVNAYVSKKNREFIEEHCGIISEEFGIYVYYGKNYSQKRGLDMSGLSIDDFII